MAVLEAFFRTKVCRGTSLTVTDLNHSIYEFNHLCRSAQQFKFWHHVGLVADWRRYISTDGVHLNTHGMVKYFKSVQSALSIFHLCHAMCNLLKVLLLWYSFISAAACVF